ncbi:MAG: ABC transporter permease [Candidatus Dependentiae bacterium]|nr:ABC transporter permease [Candidatus Dependentiae bacterium]
MNKLFYLNTCKELILADLMVFKEALRGKVIDMAIWVALSIFVTAYIMPYFGLSHDFGPFQFGGIIASLGLFELYTNVFELTADLEGDRVINYGLTLPIPSWMAIVSKSAYYAIANLTLALIMLPIGKLCLWNQLPLHNIAYGKLFIALLLQSICYACFVPWTATLISNLSNLGSVWARFIFPMWFMGGFQFSWMALHTILPTLAYIDLINPVIYATESTRAALLGQEGYLPFLLCCGALLLFSIICMWHALKRMKKRLDFV